jgi:hypothetical protein
MSKLEEFTGLGKEHSCRVSDATTCDILFLSGYQGACLVWHVLSHAKDK